jgi:hypothetical protein
VQYAQELGRVGRLPDTDQVSPYLYAHAHVPTNDCRTPGDVSCTHIYSSLTSNTGRFLQLLRHLIWMHTARLGPVPLAPVDELAWVFDGVQVTLGKRNLYVCGRTHTQRPCHLSARQKSEVGFRDRLMIPAPLHRAALARLVRAGKKGVLCDDSVRALVQWLDIDSATTDGGWSLRPYVNLVFDIHDSESESPLPVVGESNVCIHPVNLRSLRTVLLHWASTTPEVHVLPTRTVHLARRWLQQGGRVPITGMKAVANTSPLLFELMQHDTRSKDPRAGHFWQLSEDLQNLLTRMVLVVERSVRCTQDAVAVSDEVEVGRVQEACEYSLPAGVARTDPTALEHMLWHAEYWPGFPVVRGVGRYAFDEDRQGHTKARTHDRSHQSQSCSKYPTRPAEHNRGHGLLTAACARCARITGFSILPAPESPKAVFELIVTRFAPRDHHVDEPADPADEDA